MVVGGEELVRKDTRRHIRDRRCATPLAWHQPCDSCSQACSPDGSWFFIWAQMWPSVLCKMTQTTFIHQLRFAWNMKYICLKYHNQNVWLICRISVWWSSLWKWSRVTGMVHISSPWQPSSVCVSDQRERCQAQIWGWTRRTIRRSKERASSGNQGNSSFSALRQVPENRLRK